jgi:FkbM family methyltransferase
MLLSNLTKYYFTRFLQRAGAANQTLELPLGAKCFIPNPPGITKIFITSNGAEEFMQDPSLRCVLQMIKTAKTFWDVGANIGLFSLFAKAVNSSVAVVSVEASTDTYGELCRNWSLCPEGWICINAAVGSEEGVATLSRDLGGLNHIVSPDDAKFKDNSEVRPTTTLDNLAQLFGNPRIDVLKIDVEGMELAVLKGAQRLLSERRIGAIVLEADGHGARYGFSDSDVFTNLAAYGYSLDHQLTESSRASGNCAVFKVGERPARFLDRERPNIEAINASSTTIHDSGHR